MRRMNLTNSVSVQPLFHEKKENIKLARIQVGDVFGDFSLKNHKDTLIDTAAFTEKKLLLSLHPLAWTVILPGQMQSLEVNYETFKALNTVPFGHQ